LTHLEWRAWQHWRAARGPLGPGRLDGLATHALAWLVPYLAKRRIAGERLRPPWDRPPAAPRGPLSAEQARWNLVLATGTQDQAPAWWRPQADGSFLPAPPGDEAGGSDAT